MDLDQVLQHSRHFYHTHQLADWAAGIPDPPFWSADRADILTYAQKSGLSAGFAFPPFALQNATIQRLVEETARKKAPGVLDNQQYREPFLADAWTKTANGNILQRTDNLGPRTEGPYLLLYSPNPCQAVWGRSGKQILDLFRGKGWSSLTVPEYLVLQRFLCEKHGDHRFYDVPQDEASMHWIWLLDSGKEDEMTVAMGGQRGIVNLQAASINNRDARRAGMPTLILAMR